MYALVEINGKQYKAEKGGVLKVDWLKDEAGSILEFDKVLFLSKDTDKKIGNPYVDGAKVSATVGVSLKSKKIQVIKFKRRKGYHRTQGHRQRYTVLQVDEISG